MIRNKKRFDQIKELASQGLTKSQISQELGIALQTVLHYERIYGLDITKAPKGCSKNWTADEEDYLCYAMEDPEVVMGEVAEELGRSIRSVTNKVRELKSRGLLPGQAGRLYSDEDLAYLIKYYNKLPLSELAETLKRTPGAIAGKAQRLGLGKPNRPDMVERIRELAEQGYYLNQIAQKLQTSHSHILYYEQAYGFKVPREPEDQRKERVKKNMRDFFKRRSVH